MIDPSGAVVVGVLDGVVGEGAVGGLPTAGGFAEAPPRKLTVGIALATVCPPKFHTVSTAQDKDLSWVTLTQRGQVDDVVEDNQSQADCNE